MSFNSVTVVRPSGQIVSQIRRDVREGNLLREDGLPTGREPASGAAGPPTETASAS